MQTEQCYYTDTLHLHRHWRHSAAATVQVSNNINDDNDLLQGQSSTAWHSNYCTRTRIIFIHCYLTKAIWPADNTLQSAATLRTPLLYCVCHPRRMQFPCKLNPLGSKPTEIRSRCAAYLQRQNEQSGIVAAGGVQTDKRRYTDHEKAYTVGTCADSHLSYRGWFS